ncbi:VirB4 family type IV secretion/conjugal transfer ATPase [Dongshaea marina]|uniref:VirB4 family type IV secretion/conjugal transfer ATPase n=1 Tax=Dongshaea marina TaxID=2047966 RepID=UPI000D3E7C13|nr:VirB4 family type IV secretion/conjugal transfer ATPase [Dongshaea marina]
MATKYAQAMEREVSLAEHIPYSSHLNENTIILKDGSLMRCFQIQGTTFETKGAEDLELMHERLNSLWKSFCDGRTSIYTHTIRRRVDSTIEGVFPDSFSRRFNEKYSRTFDSKVLINEIYLTIVEKGPLQIGKQLLKAQPLNVEAKKHEIEGRLREFEQKCRLLVASMGEVEQPAEDEDSGGASTQELYGIRTLGCYTSKSGNLCSEPMELLSYLITNVWQTIRVPSGSIDAAIGHAWVEVGRDTIALRRAEGVRYAQGLDIKEYAGFTDIGMLQKLLYENSEFVLTQSFTLMTRKQGHGFMKSRRRQMSNSGDGAVTQIEALDLAIDELLDNAFGFGQYHLSLMLYGDTVEQANKARNSAARILSEQDLMGVPITIATDAAFFAQLPGNWRYRPRVVGLTTRNFAGLCPFFNFMSGKKQGNPWGPALTRFKTISGQPLFLNLHSSRPGRNEFGKMNPGNTRIIGMIGTGKTVLLAILAVQMQKFQHDKPFGLVFFDKDRAAEALILALGGTYLRVEDGAPTGFNPFQMKKTVKNIAFIKELMEWIVSQGNRQLTVREKQALSLGVDAVMDLPFESRRISALLQNITADTTEAAMEDNIRMRLAPWCHTHKERGKFAWVFDNPVDLLDFEVTPNIGIDGTQFLDNKSVCTPISLYLLHRLQEVVDGRRFALFMDECWKWVNDVAFGGFVKNLQNTFRKRNAIGIYATQMPSQLLESPVAAGMVQGCATEIYLPNPKAIHSEYVGKLGLSEEEYQIVKSFDTDSRLALVKQGDQSAIICMELPSSLSDEISVLSASTDELPLLEQAIKEVGNNPDDWIPVFLEKVRRNKQRRDVHEKIADDVGR